MNRTLDVVTSLAATLARLGGGLRSGHLGERPDKLLELYEFEGCPYCRKVREGLSILDLEAMIYPCPRGGSRFRPIVKERGGKHQFPFLVDPNTGVAMYESNDILAYLFRVYGDGEVPISLRLGPLTDATAMLASAWRPGFGGFARPSRAPEKPLELWSFEASPFCRITREVLSTLEIPYRLHNVAKGSPSRQAFLARSGKMQVPFLHDPNTGVDMFESADIVDYLRRTYEIQ
ncbi:glutathione S-transferase N-terminal domain-containing protein [Polyangium mundeleinium]|uniref:Glutathione S-transferase N-terminal domain-containing protein n=1 Tax=Polyangium mundeleinium TaxID=2995306 RepID=A0ABT5EUX2_9BACT|nr:glutathione S-transferase N-terminal domain-containing protein [Polyangium mundeleinium]MDC0745618.1 glutathione S-transferase N-terminal domain-containing protein [Polyangium mundeleinium]